MFAYRGDGSELAFARRHEAIHALGEIVDVG
jgi:hypothetical protein